jgi:hypothetical protein
LKIDFLGGLCLAPCIGSLRARLPGGTAPFLSSFMRCSRRNYGSRPVKPCLQVSPAIEDYLAGDFQMRQRARSSPEPQRPGFNV